MKKIVKLCAVLVVAAGLAGCARTAPIENIKTPVSTGHTSEQVKQAIFSAGARYKWVMTETKPGVIHGRQQTRAHSVDVTIPYSATGYAITYDNSFNLRAANGKIHKNYNRWVRNLNKEIQLKLPASSI
ncbi:hypothetical protein [Serratia microhaemolytica]|uniref:hypothetical protein n=1 Tax=Serratia microhaemolytica TaxID=2675110 RepID=UPI000FDED2ED|nr:hypothetical protein [Serratia microhaemolytica]